MQILFNILAVALQCLQSRHGCFVLVAGCLLLILFTASNPTFYKTPAMFSQMRLDPDETPSYSASHLDPNCLHRLVPKVINGSRTTNVSVSTDYIIDYMTEEVAMKIPACMDHKLAADVRTSRLWIKRDKNNENGRKTYLLGETIPVFIKLYNGYGKPLDKGGAILRARMFNVTKKAYATAHMKDNGDGSYSTKFEALWTGNSTIKVKLAYTPETIRATYYNRQKPRSTRGIQTTFAVDQHEELTHCHPIREYLELNYSRICNLTSKNSGMPWYCGRPSNIHLSCKDWTGVNYNHYPELQLTSCEDTLMERSSHDIKQALDVYVGGDGETISLPKRICKQFNVSSLWTRKQPTGFMYDDKWYLRHCKGPEQMRMFSCLKNRKFIFFGDSTVRQWYKYVLIEWECVQTTERWTKLKWTKPSACMNTEYNFTVHYRPHSQPSNNLGNSDFTTTSISRHLDEIGNDENVVALLHIFQHHVMYHHSAFKEKIHRIRPSVENILMRNKLVKVFIKGPHTHYTDTHRLTDFYGLVYRKILYDEFVGLHDRVIYLDNSDITIAVANKNKHPSYNVVGAMVAQMLAYIC